MKRFLRNLLFLFLGLILGGVATFASAESRDADRSVNTILGYECKSGATVIIPWAVVTNPYLLCATGGLYPPSAADGTCRSGSTPGPVACTLVGSSKYIYSCPSGQNWTLSGATCTRPDCAAGEVRDANGVCQSVACPAGQFSSGYYQGSAPAYACASNGCGVSFTGTYPAGRDAAGNLYAQGSYSYTGGNQGSCTPGQNGSVAAPATSSNTLTSTKPGPNGCGAGDGVITSSSGKVACVPQGTEGSIPAVNEKTSKTETFSDGSTKTTTTTEVCTGQGACASTTTITIGAASGGGAGIAGTPGASTTGVESGTDADGDGEVDSKGDCDPKSQMCGEPGHGDLYAKKGKSMQTAFTTFSNGLKASPMGQAATGFFNVSIPSGACPAMSADVAYLGVTVNLADHICAATAIEVMQMAGAVLLVLATFVAFRWAFL